MSNEKQGPESSDEKLTAVYRSLSQERAPEHLNEQVLREASGAVRSPYAPPIRWSRPLAWAAVITLTVTILLQVTDLTTPEPAQPGLSGTAEREDGPAGIAGNEPTERGELRGDPLTPATPEAQQERIPLAAETAASPADSGAKTVDAAKSRDRPAFTVQGTNVPESAEQSARAQGAEGAPKALPQAAGFAEQSWPGEPSPACSAEETADAASWYACVERLREAGLDAIADEQLEALLEAFPDFNPPR